MKFTNNNINTLPMGLVLLLRAATLAAAAPAMTTYDFAAVRAEASASPEAMPDPMELALYVEPASGSAGPTMLLGESASICRTDYTAGYTLRCQAPFSSVYFNINGKWQRTEVAAPFYIAGDVAGKAIPWTPPKVGTPFTVACKSNKKLVRSVVTITC